MREHSPVVDPTSDPFDEISRFHTCANYPRNDDYAIRMLVQALARAARKHNLSPGMIVDRCIELSEFCPTEHDIDTVAIEFVEAERRKVEATRNQYAEWEKQYGKPVKPPAGSICQCGCGRSWKEIGDTSFKNRVALIEKLRDYFKPKDLQSVGIGRIFRAMKDLGYELNGDQRKLMDGQ